MDGSNAKPMLTDELYNRRSSQNPSGLVWSRSSVSNPPERIDHMPAAKKPLGQQYYEEVESLKSQGMSNAEAIREVAKRRDMKENAIRGGIHQYRSRHLDGGATSTRRGRRAAPRSVDDYLADAKRALETARDLIDQEVDQAKAELDAAQKRYDDLVASTKDRKEDIDRRLAALS